MNLEAHLAARLDVLDVPVPGNGPAALGAHQPLKMIAACVCFHRATAEARTQNPLLTK